MQTCPDNGNWYNNGENYYLRSGMIKRAEGNMKILYSGIFRYALTRASKKELAGTCGIDIVKYDNGVFCIMMTENKKNKGVPFTNACDRIATMIYAGHLKKVPPDKTIWLEHCPAGRTHRAHVDLIQFHRNFKGGDPGAAVFSRPRWKRFFESRRIIPAEFLEKYGYVLKELAEAHIIYAVEDRKGLQWRVWANQEGFFIVSSNASAGIPEHMLDAHGVTAALQRNNRFFDAGMKVEETFTNALVKGFLNKGL